MLRYLTAGESHGKYLSGILEGFPAGVKITPDYIAAQLRRRRQAPGRSARQARETDKFEIISGLSGDLTRRDAHHAEGDGILRAPDRGKPRADLRR